MPVIAREFHLRSRPVGRASEDNFTLVERALADPAPGQLLVRNLWMSVDPYMRGRMDEGESYIAPFQIGQPLEGAAVGVVEASAAPGFSPGDLVTHFAGWRDRAVVEESGASVVDERVAPLQAHLGPLGVPGLTAHFGLLRVAQARPGETVFVSAASGAVGSIVCQIARIQGCRVVASAGSEAKVAWLRDELGVDAVIDRRAASDFHSALAAACPQGLDVYFDNVGGVQLDAALLVARPGARFVLCGMIEQYDSGTHPTGVRNLYQVVVKHLSLQGLLITRHMDALPELHRDMARWIGEGRIRWRETVVTGLDRAPQAFLGLFKGENVGKMLVDLRAG